MGERIKPNTPRPRMPISPNIHVIGIINRVRVTSGKKEHIFLHFFRGQLGMVQIGGMILNLNGPYAR